MRRPILGEYGPESRQPMAARASHGGKMPVRDVMNYAEPQGPINMYNPGPGLRGGTNCGNCGSQGPTSARGDGAIGSAGIGGDRPNMGSNRRR